jgi:D-proline reductase (dithiol) PrdB
MTDSAPVRYIDGITQRYTRLGYAPYRWYYADDQPRLARLNKPLAKARIGALTTSGAYALGQVAYHYKDDTSVRAVPYSTPDSEMRFAHITQNYLVNAKRDPNCIAPLGALRTLEQEGVIGELADDMLSCMGGIYSQRRVREELIPELHRRFAEQKVDAVLLVPM